MDCDSGVDPLDYHFFMELDMEQRTSGNVIKQITVAILAVLMFAGFWAGNAAGKEYVVGLQCDRGGPTQNVGVADGCRCPSESE